MASGSVIYFGSAPEATSWFEEAGYKCPIHYNPADFILELVTDNFASEDESLKDKEKIKQSLINSWAVYTKHDPARIYRNDATVNNGNDAANGHHNGSSELYKFEENGNGGNGATTNGHGHTSKPPRENTSTININRYGG